MAFLNPRHIAQHKRLVKLFLTAVFACCGTATALTANTAKIIDDAANYLINQQNSDGCWSQGEKRIVDTIEVLKALEPLAGREDVLTAIDNSLSFISDINQSSNDYLGRKLRILANTTSETGSIKATLLAAQNADGGWGTGKTKQSDIIDTIAVVEALLQDQTSSSVLAGARDFIINSQEPSGCWILADEANMPSDIARTAMGLIALKGLERAGLASAATSNAAALAQNFLESKGEPNDPNVWSSADLALAYRALLLVKQSYDIQDFLAELADRRQSNGSWDNDVFTTALALEALNAASPPELGAMADLAVFADYIRFDPAAPQNGQAVNITAKIVNKGTSSATNFEIAFYNADPCAGGKLIGSYQFNEPNLLPAGSAIDVNVVYYDTASLYDEQLIIVVVDPNNDIAEPYEYNNYAAKILSFGGKPDLTIEDFDVPVGDVSAFEPIEIVATFLNQGARLETAFAFRVIDLNDPNYQGDFMAVALGNGEGYIANIHIVEGLPAGVHTLEVIADPNSAAEPNGAIDESEENNNDANGIITVIADNNTGSPDLVVSFIKVEPSVPVEAVGDVNVAVSVINKTGSDVSSAFWVKLEQSNGGAPTTIGSKSISSLASGRQVIIIWEGVQFSDDGTWTLTATADCNNDIAETANSNNALSVELYVAPAGAKPNLVFRSFDAVPSAVEEGDLVQLKAVLANVSPNSVNDVVVRFFDGGNQIGEDVNIPLMDGGQSVWLQYGATFTPGTKQLSVVVDPNDEIDEIDDVNNSAYAVLVVYPADGRPDLRIESNDIGIVPFSPAAFADFNITAVIHNDGNAMAENIVVRFIDLGMDVNDGNDDFVIPDMVIDGIGAGQTGTAKLLLTGGMLWGQHTIRVIIDPNGAGEPNGLIDEPNENNNQASRTFQVRIGGKATSGMDLTVESVRAEPNIAVGGQQVDLIVTILNRGDTDISDANSFSIELTKNIAGQGPQTINTKTWDKGLKSGQRLVWTEPNIFSANNWIITATADSDSDIDEANETNNEANMVLAVLENETLPDLTFEGNLVVEPNSPTKGQYVQIIARVKNLGSKEASNVALRILADNEPVGPDVIIGSIAGGCAVEVQMRKSLPHSVNLKGIIDPAGVINETDETNNGTQRSVTVSNPGTNLADLQIDIDDINFSEPAAVAWQTITITFTIHNDGDAASGDFYVLVTEGDPFAGGAWLIEDYIAVSSIAAGGSSTKTISYTVRPVEGGNRIYVLADRDNTVCEYDENNNLAGRSLLKSAAPDLTISASSIRFSHTDLLGNPNVRVLATVRNSGSSGAVNVTAEFSVRNDDSEDTNFYQIGETTIDSILAGQAADVDTIWRPEQDVNYTVSVWVDPDNDIIEANELNNDANKAIVFENTATEPNITLYLVENGQRSGAYPQVDLKAYDDVEICVGLDANYSPNDVDIYIWVEKPNGEWFWPSNEGGASSWFFNTAALTPDPCYSVELVVIDSQSGNIVQQDSCVFEIKAELDVSSIAIVTEDRYLRLGTPISLAPEISIFSASNQQFDANVVVRLYGPNDSNNPVHTWLDGSQSYTFQPGQSLQLELAAYDGSGITAPGDWNIFVDVNSGQGQQNKVLPVIPAAGFNVFKSLAPELLDPAEQAGVDVRIDLISSGQLMEAYLLDVVLIIDVSGTMAGEKIEAAKDAAQDFAKRLLEYTGGGHRVGVVKYHEWAEIEQPLTTDFDEVNSVIETLSASTLTNIGDGIDKAMELLADQALDRRAVAILLSDGCWNIGPNPEERAIAANSEHITIITVGFGSDVYQKTLQEVASITGGSYYFCTEDTIGQIYAEIYEEIITTGVEGIHVVDTVNYDANEIELDTDSIMPVPTTIQYPSSNDSNYTLIWDLPSLELGEAASLSYSVELFDLQPGEIRLINRLLNVEAYNTQQQAQLNLQIGPQSVTVSGAAVLGITTDKTQYAPGELATLSIGFEAPDSLAHRLITTQQHFTSGKPNRIYIVSEANGLDVNASPGNLVLAKDQSNMYLESGTLGLIVDACSGACWGNIDFIGGFQDKAWLFERTNNYLRSNRVRDVYYYDRSGEEGDWWSDANDSWYTEAGGTRVDHALITDEGWVVSVPVTTGLDAVMDTNDFTIEGWISAGAENSDAILFYKGDGDANYLRIYKHYAGGTDTLVVDYYSPTDSCSVSVGLSGSSGDWHYVALTVCGSTATVYADGNQVDKTWQYNTSDVLGALEGTPILIGGEPNSADANNFLTWPAEIDEVRIYNRILDTNEIGQNIQDNQEHLESGIDDGLVGYWNFDPCPQDQSGFDQGGMFAQAWLDNPDNAGLRQITGRSSQAEFPQKSYIVATSESIEIINAENDMLWMRFLTDRNFLWDASGIRPSSVFALGGKIYAGQDNSSAGLAIIDFVQDQARVIQTNGVYKPSDPNIDKRFETGLSFGSAGSSASLPDGCVHDVMAVTIGDTNYLAAATSGGLALIKDLNDVNNSACTDWVSRVFWAGNDLYFVKSEPNGDSLYAVYNADLVTDNFMPDAIYGYEDTNEPNLLEDRINGLFVTAGDINNTLYLATTKGLVQINENQVYRNLGTRKVYLPAESGEPNDPNYIKVLGGSSNDVTAVYVDEDANEIWAGTSEGLSSVGTLSIIDYNNTLKQVLSATSTPSLPVGTINSLSYGMAATSGGFLAFEPAVISGAPVSVRVRSIYTDNYLEPNQAVSDWTDWITESGTAVTDSSIIDPNSANKPGRSRYLELEVKLQTNDTNLTPVLEYISVGYTPAELAIDVTIEDKNGQQVSDIGRISITADHMDGSNTFTRYFDTTEAITEDYVARATLIDRITGEIQQTATDDFTVGSVAIPEIIDGNVVTDKRRYIAGEKAVITSIVTNDSNVVPVDNIDVIVTVLKPNLEVLQSYAYHIYSLQSGACDVKQFYFTIAPELAAVPNYIVEQVISINGQALAANKALFEINWSGLSDISGQLTVSPPLVKTGTEIVNIAASVTNTGNADLDDVTLVVNIYDDIGSAAIKTFELFIDLLATEQRASFNFDYNPLGLGPNTYPVTLSAQYVYDGNEQTRDLAISGFVVINPAGSSADEYVVIDLGTIDGISKAYAINNYGNVTGNLDTGSNSHTFCWRCGQMNEISLLAEDHNSTGFGISDLEQIAGSYYTPSAGPNAFIWQDGEFNDLETALSGGEPVQAYGINLRGQVTGYYTLNNSSRAFIWDKRAGEPYWDTLDNSGIFDANSTAFAITDYGDLAGYWQDDTGIRGFVRRNGVIIDAGQYDGNDTYLRSINEYGQAAGYSCGEPNTAIFYEDGVMMALDSNESMAYGINSAGDVVGTYEQGGWKAFVWQDGAKYDLTQQMAFHENNPGWELKEAYAINNEGQIVGFGTIGGSTHAYRLDPLGFEVTSPELILWLRSDTGVVKDESGFVSEWKDQTFNGHNLTASDSNRPVWTLDTSCCNPAVHFDGVDDYLNSSLIHNGNSTVFMVVDINSAQTGGLFASDDDTTGANAFEIGLGEADLRLCADSNYYQISLAETESVILEAVIDGNQVRFYKNGLHLSNANATIGTNEAKSYTHCALGKSRGGDYLEYSVAEVLVFAGALADATRQNVENYLMSKYRLYGPDSPDIAGAKLWLKADAGVVTDSNGLISLWMDQSGNNFEAIQDNNTAKPQWQGGVINCKPAVWFDGEARIEPNISPPGYLGLAGIICLDRSRSMKETSTDDPNSTRFEDAQEAAIAMLEEIRDDDIPDDYAALVEFVGDAKVEQHFTTNMDSVITEVEALNPANGNATNFKSPLDASRVEFEEHEGSFTNQTKEIILVTDGQGNSNFNAVYDAAAACKAAGITIHAVFIPLDPNSFVQESRQVLQDISDSTGGTYHEVTSEGQLSSIFLEILGIIKVGDYSTTISTVFKTSSDVSSRQVLFAEGDPNAGLNLYIDAGQLYFGVWNLEGKSGTAWGPSFIHTAIEANNTYNATVIYSYNDRIEGFLNSAAFDEPNAGAGSLAGYEPNHSLGSNSRKTLFHDGKETVDNAYVGHIAELIYYDGVLSENQRNDLELYLSQKYGLEIQHNLPPIADANVDFTVSDENWDGRADVFLSGGAYDDGNNLIYEWYEDGVLIATGANPAVELDVGVHTIELRVTDENGQTSTDTVKITVEPKSSDLVAHWKLDEDANTIAFDSSGNGYDANVINVQEPNCWGWGRVGGAIRLTADNNEYIDLNPDGCNVQYFPGGAHGRTIMGWFEAGDNESPTFFDYGSYDADSGGSRFAITVSSGRLAVTIGTHVMGTDSPGSCGSIVGWHHIAVVFPEGATRSNQVRIFLDGTPQVLYTLDDSEGPVIVDTNTWSADSYAYIGRDCDGNNFNGGIDDVRIYARGLRDSEIPARPAGQMSYRVVDLGPLEPSESPQTSEGRALDSQGNVVGKSIIFLDPNTVYYWRIDERNQWAVTEGDIWSFTTDPNGN
jgi:subtilase family serine protease/Mg-chelatase subunit ChlD